MASGDLDDAIYFILIDGQAVDWTGELDEARRRTEPENKRYVRYSYDPMDRKPFERITIGEHQTLDDATETRVTSNE